MVVLPLENARDLVDAGADVLVAGNTVFSSTRSIRNYKKIERQLKEVMSYKFKTTILMYSK